MPSAAVHAYNYVYGRSDRDGQVAPRFDDLLQISVIERHFEPFRAPILRSASAARHSLQITQPQESRPVVSQSLEGSIPRAQKRLVGKNNPASP